MVKSIQFVFFVACLVTCIQAAERNVPDKVSAVSTEIRQKRSNLWEPGYRFVPPTQDQIATEGSGVDPTFQGGARLLDIVILASVDGKLHGVNRTTGQVLWSMSNDPDAAAPSGFGSLIRTQHSVHDSEREFFIIEPQSGDIYILPPMASPTDGLQRLQLSIQQLVELSPFSFPGDEDRLFVGSKETSMVVLELETGRVKGTINADKECFWEDQLEVEEEDSDIPAPKRDLRSPVVHIGRTGKPFMGFLFQAIGLIKSTQITMSVSTPVIMELFKICITLRTVPTTLIEKDSPNGSAHPTISISSHYPTVKFLPFKLTDQACQNPYTTMACLFGVVNSTIPCESYIIQLFSPFS